MEPVTAGLAFASLINQMLNGSSSRAIANQQMQRQGSLSAMQMLQSQAGRQDAYGNETYYDPATNTWKTKLTPTQQAIINAEQTEQARSLNEDAPRARALRERLSKMSLQAGEPYNKAVQGYLYDQPQSEGAINDKLQTQLIQANADKAKEGQAGIVRQALRQGGNVNNIPAIIKAIDDKVGGTTSDSILKASQGAHSQAISDMQAHDARYLPEIEKFDQIISNGGGDASARFGNLAPQLASAQSAQGSAMQQAITSAISGGNASARNLIAANTASKFDPSALIKALSGSGKTGKAAKDGSDPQTDMSQIPGILKDFEYGRYSDPMYGSDSSFSF